MNLCTLMLIPLLCLASVSKAQSTAPIMHYLHIRGALPLVGQDRLLSDIQSQFTDPLDQAVRTSHIRRFYNNFVDGAGAFSISLILEEKDQEGAQFVHDFMQSNQTAGFHSLKVQFKDVVAINEYMDLKAGLHRPNSVDHTFDQDSEINKEFKFSSIQEWNEFTDRLGFAMQTKQNQDFLKGLAWFFQDTAEFDQYKTTVLNHDDVVMAELMPMLTFADGTLGGHGNESPFYDWPFARECWTATERGMCFQP